MQVHVVLVRRAGAAGPDAMLKAGWTEVVPPLFRSMEGFHSGGSTIEAGEFAEWCGR
jgi:hypothetical protein